MKKKMNRRTASVYRPAYPNQAAPGYFTHKLLNAITAIVSSMGLLMAFLFLITLA